jgi:adenine deaminase
MSRKELVEAARGDRPLDLAITNVQLVNVFTCEIYPADIGIWGDRIAVVQPAGQSQLAAARVIDGRGKWAIPGLVDTHVHIESSMITPANFAAAVLPLGTTTVIIDPHEIGNVLGMEGVKYMIAASEGLPLRVYITVPSCVPAVPGIETAGASFGPAEVAEMVKWPRVIGIAEVMDYQGVIYGAERMRGIVDAGLDAHLTIQGHSPSVSGRPLDAYIAAGCENDHEVRSAEETWEKLRLGMLPLVKDSSYGKPIPTLAPMLKSLPLAEIALCTDDIEPADLLANGHMNRVVAACIANGIAPALAVRWGSLVGAREYGLRDHGAIAPGYFADLSLLDSLDKVRADEVIVGGKVVARKGAMCAPVVDPLQDAPQQNSVHLQPLSADAFRLKAPAREGEFGVRVLTYGRPSRLETVRARAVGGYIPLAALGEDVCWVSVVPRHGQTHPPSLAPLKGLGLARGAMASTVSHDSHNLIVAGREPSDMLLAVRELEACGGGVVAVADGRVLYKVALPVAGLLSTLPTPELAQEIEKMNEAIGQLGIHRDSAALALAGIALPVSPFFKITDMGLVDVETQKLVPGFE